MQGMIKQKRLKLMARSFNRALCHVFSSPGLTTRGSAVWWGTAAGPPTSPWSETRWTSSSPPGTTTSSGSCINSPWVCIENFSLVFWVICLFRWVCKVSTQCDSKKQESSQDWAQPAGVGPGGGQCGKWGGGQAENCRDGREVSPCHDPGTLWGNHKYINWGIEAVKIFPLCFQESLILMKNQLCWSVDDIKNLKLNGRKLGEVKNYGDSMHVVS